MMTLPIINSRTKCKHVVEHILSLFFFTRNPTKGVIINHPNGKDVYKGVPHDYTGKVCLRFYLFNEYFEKK